jgi:hypothetical protein
MENKLKDQKLKRFIIQATIIFLQLVLLGINAVGQGCGDAGACSIGSIEEFESHDHDQVPMQPTLSVTLEQTAGLGEKFTFISQTSVIAEYRFLQKTSVMVKVPFIFATGNLGNSSGVGDVLVSVIHQLYRKGESQFGILVAGKIRSNNADFSFGGNPLPMAYQTSLGTYDIIFGAQYLWKTWDFYVAYQHPFGRNQNEYLHPEGETDESRLYFESAQLKRGDDLALRVSKIFTLKKNQSLVPGVMPIYRLQKSEIVRFDENVVLDDSDGLTFNLFLTYTKKLKNNALINLTGAFPVIDRDYRADGLTRNFVLTFRITQFW